MHVTPPTSTRWLPLCLVRWNLAVSHANSITPRAVFRLEMPFPVSLAWAFSKADYKKVFLGDAHLPPRLLPGNVTNTFIMTRKKTAIGWVAECFGW